MQLDVDKSFLFVLFFFCRDHHLSLNDNITHTYTLKQWGGGEEEEGGLSHLLRFNERRLVAERLKRWMFYTTDCRSKMNRVTDGINSVRSTMKSEQMELLNRATRDGASGATCPPARRSIKVIDIDWLFDSSLIGRDQSIHSAMFKCPTVLSRIAKWWPISFCKIFLLFGVDCEDWRIRWNRRWQRPSMKTITFFCPALSRHSRHVHWNTFWDSSTSSKC